jgi:NADPH:quinone reductase-like Zn-dependent oxidoreductase
MAKTGGQKTMRAAVYRQYGGPEVVAIEQIDRPEPSDGEVLVRVHASTVGSADMRARSLNLPGFGPIGRLAFGIFGPRKKVLGTELAGVVEKVGASVTRFKAGDRVFGDTGAGFGAHAEYKTITEDGPIAHIPGNLSFDKAAAICFGGTVALQFLRDKAGIAVGDTVLVNGASGAVGLAMVQLASYFGARVTGVTSAANVELVRSLGAGTVIDYGAADFARNAEVYDIIVDTVGNAPWSRSRGSLADKGRLLIVSGTLAEMVAAVFVSKKNGKRALPGMALGTGEDLRFLAKLIERGKFTPVIEQIYPFEEIAKAHAHVDTGRKRGSVVINLV